MANEVVRVGISTCPNDTFAFHALMENKIDTEGLKFSFDLLDVQELNQALIDSRPTPPWDVAKCSFHAALYLADSHWVMPSGSALGFGVGPLLLSNQKDSVPVADSVVGCPGSYTTASMLYRLFYGQGTIRQMIFSEIMPSLQRGDIQFGVCIHEGRFTYANAGLCCVADLGTRWESAAQTALPLGGILGCKSMGLAKLWAIQRCLSASIEYGHAHRQETLLTMRRFAQEFDDEVLFRHVDLYVNEWTQELGPLGREALDQLSALARARGLVKESLSSDRLEVLPDVAAS